MPQQNLLPWEKNNVVQTHFFHPYSCHTKLLLQRNSRKIQFLMKFDCHSTMSSTIGSQPAPVTFLKGPLTSQILVWTLRFEAAAKLI